MARRIGKPHRLRLAVAATLLLTVAAAGPSWPQAASRPVPPAQDAQLPPAAPPQAETAPAEEPRKENPGLLNELGKLLETPGAVLPTLKSPRETIEDAADALSRLAKSPGVKGRAVCPPAPNGAPDCKRGADKLCQDNGFKEGKSLDIDTARNCSARSLLSGRKPDESECRTDTYVTRAVCQ
jgi:hypothetical protein